MLPIFFDILGGLISYFALRHDDPQKAKNCLYLGIILTGVWIAILVIVTVMVGFDEANLIPTNYSA